MVNNNNKRGRPQPFGARDAAGARRGGGVRPGGHSNNDNDN